MTAIPKTRVRRTLGRDAFTAFFGTTRHCWEVILDGHVIAEFDNHPDALTYAHQRATTAQREHVEKLEHAAHEARTAALNARPKPRVKINITSDAVEEFKKAKARIEAHENLRARYGQGGDR